MMTRLQLAVIRSHADAWLLWGDREQFTADDLRDLLAELDALRRTMRHPALREADDVDLPPDPPPVLPGQAALFDDGSV
jgi:hypothetical protein